MRFDLFGFEFTVIRQLLRVSGFMVYSIDATGRYVDGFTRHLLYISHDPIGWKFQILFISFHKSYMRKYNEFLFRTRYPHGYPTKTKGVKSEDRVKVISLGGHAQESNSTEQA
jgi:hypothetical protein